MLFLCEDEEALLVRVLLIYFNFFSFSPLFPPGGDVNVLPVVPISGCVSLGVVAQHCSSTGTAHQP